MKSIIISALIASAALTGAASAEVGVGAAAAAAHFNQDIDTTNNRVALLDAGFDGVAVSSRNGVLGGVFDQFNADYDTENDLRGLDGATLVGGSPAYGAGIFAGIKAEGLENE